MSNKVMTKRIAEDIIIKRTIKGETKDVVVGNYMINIVSQSPSKFNCQIILTDDSLTTEELQNINLQLVGKYNEFLKSEDNSDYLRTLLDFRQSEEIYNWNIIEDSI